MNQQVLLTIIELFEGLDKMDQLNLSLSKLLYGRLENTNAVARTLLGLLKLPDSEERDKVISQLTALLDGDTAENTALRIGPAKIIAQAERQHELLEAAFASAKKILRGGGQLPEDEQREP